MHTASLIKTAVSSRLGRFIFVGLRAAQRDRFPIWVLPACAALLCFGCQTPVGETFPDQATASTEVSLRSGDVVNISFSGAPELNQSQRIQTDGKINLPLIGEVQASGKSVTGLQEELAARYREQLKNSTVVVKLESSVTQVVISGYVGKPGKLAFDRPTTIFQAIMEAGGATEYGNLKQVHVVRVVNGVQHTQILNLSPALQGQKTRAFYVKDGDVIYVPQSYF
jgi:polysaccharide biosynthesis/export protein